MAWLFNSNKISDNVATTSIETTILTPVLSSSNSLLTYDYNDVTPLTISYSIVATVRFTANGETANYSFSSETITDIPSSTSQTITMTTGSSYTHFYVSCSATVQSTADGFKIRINPEGTYRDGDIASILIATIKTVRAQATITYEYTPTIDADLTFAASSIFDDIVTFNKTIQIAKELKLLDDTTLTVNSTTETHKGTETHNGESTFYNLMAATSKCVSTTASIPDTGYCLYNDFESSTSRSLTVYHNKLTDGRYACIALLLALDGNEKCTSLTGLYFIHGKNAIIDTSGVNQLSIYPLFFMYANAYSSTSTSGCTKL